MTKLQIKISYEDQELVLMTPQISSIPRNTLKEPVGSLEHLQQEIIDTLDSPLLKFSAALTARAEGASG